MYSGLWPCFIPNFGSVLFRVLAEPEVEFDLHQSYRSAPNPSETVRKTVRLGVQLIKITPRFIGVSGDSHFSGVVRGAASPEIRGEKGSDRMTRLTPDKQYALMTLFTIFHSPLYFGGNMPSNDGFTLSLHTNEEVLRMYKDGLEVMQLFNSDGNLPSHHVIQIPGRYI
jgi:hypothetical protein